MTVNQSLMTAKPTLVRVQELATNAMGMSSRPPESDYVLSGLIGRQLSTPLAYMQKTLEEINNTKQFSQKNMAMLSSGVSMANKLAMQSQQIARLAGGRLRQSHESLKVDVLLLAALQERADSFSNRGIEVFQRIHPVEVIVDGGLLYSLLQAALDWACGVGRRLTVTLEIKNWPEHGLLVLKTSRLVAHSRSDEGVGHVEDDTVEWFLLNAISNAMGLSINRVVSAADTVLTIEFTRTVKRLSGLTAVEMQTGPESMYGESKLMAGCRLLVITDDARLQAEIRSICRGTGLVVDSVLNAAQGVRFCEMQLPHLVIIDQLMRSDIFDQLHEDLRKADPIFPFIEIASTANTLEMAGWTSDSMTRLSRDVLGKHLAESIALELSKVM